MVAVCKWSKAPKHKPCWVNFINQPDSEPAIVQAKTHCGGMCPGMRFSCWAFIDNFYLIWNQAGNPVWCHMDNLVLISKGTVQGISETYHRCTDYYLCLDSFVNTNLDYLRTYKGIN